MSHSNSVTAGPLTFDGFYLGVLVLSYCYITAVSACVVVGVILYRNYRDARFSTRCLYFLAPAASAIVIGALIGRAADAVFFPWNAPRLAPVFGLWRGYPLYPAPGGVLTGHDYGPISALIYAPALLAPSPTIALLTGAFVAMLLTAVPVAVLLLKSSRANSEAGAFRSTLIKLCVFCLFLFFSFSNAPLEYSMFNIHADAPALGFGALACWTLLKWPAPRRDLSYGTAALFAAMAVWSKQVQAPLAVALPLYVLATEGFRPMLRFIAYFAGIGLLVSALMVALFGPFKDMYYNMFVFMSRFKLNVNSAMEGAAVAGRIASYCAVPAAICMVAIALDFARLRTNVRQFLAGNEWTLPALLALLNFPTAFLGFVKFGGNVNNLSFVAYYIAIAAAMATLQTLSTARERGVVRAMIVAEVVLSAVLLDRCAVQFAQTRRNFATARDLWSNETQVACEFERRHPRELFCAFNPLAGLFANGQYYHFDYEVSDHIEAGVALTDAEYRKHIPATFKYVGSQYGYQLAGLKYLKEYSESVSVPELPGWTLYRKPEPGVKPDE